jgi:hypothetical protein
VTLTVLIFTDFPNFSLTLIYIRFKDDQQVAKQAAMSNMDEDTTRERSAAFVWTPKFRYGTR